MQNGAKLVTFNFFGNLSVPEFTVDELAPLAAPENLYLFQERFKSFWKFYKLYLPFCVCL